jgi:hypothetical protein
MRGASTSRSFDQLVGEREQLVWNLEVERLRRFEIDRELEFGRLLARRSGFGVVSLTPEVTASPSTIRSKRCFSIL